MARDHRNPFLNRFRNGRNGIPIPGRKPSGGGIGPLYSGHSCPFLKCR